MSKRKPNFFESDRGREFYDNIFQDSLNKNNFKLYSRKTFVGAVFEERFNHTFGDLLKKLVLKKEKAIGMMYYLQ